MIIYLFLFLLLIYKEELFISILSINEKYISIFAIKENNHLDRIYFDNKIVEFCIKEFENLKKN